MKMEEGRLYRPGDVLDMQDELPKLVGRQLYVPFTGGCFYRDIHTESEIPDLSWCHFMLVPRDDERVSGEYGSGQFFSEGGVPRR